MLADSDLLKRNYKQQLKIGGGEEMNDKQLFVEVFHFADWQKQIFWLQRKEAMASVVGREGEDLACSVKRSAREECTRGTVDILQSLAPVRLGGDVVNINELPEELLLEIFLCLPPTNVLEVRFHQDSKMFSDALASLALMIVTD